MEELTVGRLLLLLEHQHGRIMYEVIEMDGVCTCGANDLVSLEVAADDNTGWEQEVGYHEPNERVEIITRSCLKVLTKELEENRNTFKIIPKSQEAWYKENIARSYDY